MIFLYIILIVGLYLLLFSSNKSNNNKSHYKKNKSKYIKRSKVYNHLLTIYIAAYGVKGEKRLNISIKISLVIFIVFFMIFARELFVLKALLISILPLIIMYILLRLKVYVQQIDGSYEGIFYVSELLNQYKINHKNMLEALMQSIRYLENCPYAQMQTYRMSMKLKLYTDEDSVMDIVNIFAKSINTNWAKMLSNSIFLSVFYSQDVTEALEDILSELRRVQIVYEKSHQNTSEGFIIVKYILPIIYIGSVYIGIHHFGLDFAKYLRYQFLTPVGIKMTILNIVLFLANILIMVLFKKRKFDLY